MRSTTTHDLTDIDNQLLPIVEKVVNKMPTQLQKDSIISKLQKLEHEDLKVLKNLDVH